jgi:hypothetical protein
VGEWANPPYAQVTGFFSDDMSLGGVVRKARSGTHGNTANLTTRQMYDLEEFVKSIDGDLAATGIGSVSDDQPPHVIAIKP